jgi:hypothetical protein
VLPDGGRRVVRVSRQIEDGSGEVDRDAVLLRREGVRDGAPDGIAVHGMTSLG